MVVSPTGHVLDQLGAAPGLLTLDIDPNEIDAVRQNLPVLANRKF